MRVRVRVRVRDRVRVRVRARVRVEADCVADLGLLRGFHLEGKIEDDHAVRRGGGRAWLGLGVRG